jgi:hypothetical protein
MRALLSAVAAHLASALALPVHVCPEEALPDSCSLPCLSLADGAVSVTSLAGGRREEELEAHVSCHLAPHEPETALSGEGGLLELSAQVRSALEGQLLGLPGLVEARLVGEEPSRLHEWRGQPLMSRRSLFRYLREVI